MSLTAVGVAQTNWVVQADNSTAMPSLAAAVAATSEGDVIRILGSVAWVGGTLTITKSCRIVGNPVLGGSSVLFAYAQGALLVQLAPTREQSQARRGADPGLIQCDEVAKLLASRCSSTNASRRASRKA